MIQTFLERICTWLALWCCEQNAAHYIFRGGDFYLGRFYLLGGDGHGRAPGWRGRCKINLFLHHFWSSDGDGLHNHPYVKSCSLILTGGYYEWRRQELPGQAHILYQRGRRYLPGDVNVIGQYDFHRVVLSDPARGAWTLFYGGKKHGRGWGFIDTETGVFKMASGET